MRLLPLLLLPTIAQPRDHPVDGFASLVSLSGEAKQIGQFSYRAEGKASILSRASTRSGRA